MCSIIWAGKVEDVGMNKLEVIGWGFKRDGNEEQELDSHYIVDYKLDNFQFGYLAATRSAGNYCTKWQEKSS